MEIISKINWVDILIVIIMVRISYVAFQDGLSHEIFPLIGTAATAALSLHYYHQLAVFVHNNAVTLPEIVLDFAMFLVLIIVFGLTFKLLRTVVDKLIKVTWHPALEKFGGLVCGILKAAIVTSIVLIMLALMPLPYMQRSIRDKSLMGMHFLRIAPNIHSKVSWAFPTMKIKEGSTGGEGLVQQITADKSIAQK